MADKNDKNKGRKGGETRDKDRGNKDKERKDKDDKGFLGIRGLR